MTKVIQPQRKLGQIDISKIEIDLRCRDEIPKVMLGLQHIYCNPEIREKVFKLLQELIPGNISTDNGRPGMNLWKILVLGCIRLTCNWNYDKLHDIANNHQTIREMMGHGPMDKDIEAKYSLQALKDNVSLFTPEILERINQIVVEAGHNLLNKGKGKGKKNEKNGELNLKSDSTLKLHARCDSFVVETDVHFPTDINLLFDGFRKMVTLISRLCGELDISGWRNSADNIKKVKKLFHKVRKMKRSNSKDPVRIAKKEEMIKKAHLAYISLVEFYLDRADNSMHDIKIKMIGSVSGDKISEIQGYMVHVDRQVDQIRRRVIGGESIQHEEKVFSIFEEHTEWISKGKARVPQELGLKVCILEDQYGFILHNRVMENETDEKAAVPMVEETKKKYAKYANLISCSFDKGFYSPGNKKRLMELLELVILPKKGKLSESDKRMEYSEEFQLGRRKHSGVESAINGLENHGLDRCLDNGLYGFKRYVSFAVLARNIETLGSLIREQQLKSLKRKERNERKEKAKFLIDGDGIDLEKLRAA
jgi:IS5 family transposase